jgi:2-C-methyl-D-erythritol 4-phosphate cytidylyltransferase
MRTAIIVGAGKGERMKNSATKAFIELRQKPIISYSMLAFQKAKTIDKIILVVAEQDIKKTKDLAEKLNITKLFEITAGGEERQDSVYFGLTASPPQTTVAVIHDAARPLVTTKIIDTAVNALEGDGLVPGIEVKDTIKKINGKFIETTLNRKELVAAQTPQVFASKSLIEAHNIARTFDFYTTDDAALMEKQKYKIMVIEGNNENIKITTPEDLLLAEIILERRNS